MVFKKNFRPFLCFPKFFINILTDFSKAGCWISKHLSQFFWLYPNFVFFEGYNKISQSYNPMILQIMNFSLLYFAMKPKLWILANYFVMKPKFLFFLSIISVIFGLSKKLKIGFENIVFDPSFETGFSPKKLL